MEIEKSSSNRVIIADALRLPTGKRFGLYKNVIPESFTAHLFRKLMQRNPALINKLSQVILSTAVGTGGNMARYIALEAGVDETIPAFTIDAQCVGSYKSIEMGFALIKAGMADVVIAGGMESSSMSPTRIYNKKDDRFNENGYQYAAFAPSRFGDSSLLGTAEATAQRLGISKQAMVNWTIQSNERGSLTLKNKLLAGYLTDYEGVIDDETIRNTEMLKRAASINGEKLIDGTTSCQFSDGAALAILCNERICLEHGISPAFEILDIASTATSINETPIAFETAILQLLRNNDILAEEIDLFEINESFALKPLYFQNNYEISPHRINVLGGNLAFGHPFGASGAMNLIHLMAALHIRGKNNGIVAASAAGGLGNALLIQRL